MQNEVKRIRHQFKQYSKLVSEAMQEMCSYFQSDDFKKFKAQFVDGLKRYLNGSASQPLKTQSTIEESSQTPQQSAATSEIVVETTKKKKPKSKKEVETSEAAEDKAFNAYKARVRNLHKNLTDDELMQKYEQYKSNKQKKLQKDKEKAAS